LTDFTHSAATEKTAPLTPEPETSSFAPSNESSPVSQPGGIATNPTQVSKQSTTQAIDLEETENAAEAENNPSQGVSANPQKEEEEDAAMISPEIKDEEDDDEDGDLQPGNPLDDNDSSLQVDKKSNSTSIPSEPINDCKVILLCHSH
jgi:hypothetical protein